MVCRYPRPEAAKGTIASATGGNASCTLGISPIMVRMGASINDLSACF